MSYPYLSVTLPLGGGGQILGCYLVDVGREVPRETGERQEEEEEGHPKKEKEVHSV